jgi:hypothetical protein
MSLIILAIIIIIILARSSGSSTTAPQSRPPRACSTSNPSSFKSARPPRQVWGLGQPARDDHQQDHAEAVHVLLLQGLVRWRRRQQLEQGEVGDARGAVDEDVRGGEVAVGEDRGGRPDRAPRPAPASAWSAGQQTGTLAGPLFSAKIKQFLEHTSEDDITWNVRMVRL